MLVLMLFMAIALMSCDRPGRIEVVGEAAQPEDTTAWCSPAGCATCGLHSTFIDASCPEMSLWCSAPAPCPAPLDPLFCAANPPFDACVFVGVSVCDESNSTWCCSPDGSSLGASWYCKEPTDCPAASDCLIPECWPLQGMPGPGAPGKCAYAIAPEGAPCNDGGTHCALGVCVP